MKKNIPFLSAAVIVLALSCSSLSSLPAISSLPPSQSNGSGASSSGITNGQLGTAVRDGSVTLIVDGWSELKPADQDEETKNKKFIKVGYTIVNTGTEPYDAGSKDWAIKDSESRRFVGNNDWYLMDMTFGSSMIFPGERLHSYALFLVPQDSSDFTFLFDDQYSELNLDKVSFPLGHTPQMKEPPQQVEGEIKSDIFPMNSAQDCLDWRIQVEEMQSIVPEKNFSQNIAAGWRFATAVMTVEDKGEQSASLLDSTVWLQDPTGTRYFFDETADSEVVVKERNNGNGSETGLPSIYAQFNAGESKHGYAVFLIPLVTQPLSLVFWCGGENFPAATAKDKIYFQLPDSQTWNK